MNLPGGEGLSTAEILAFVDLAAADLLPGWVPSEHFDEHSIVRAYRSHLTGDDELFRLLTANRTMALLTLAGADVRGLYESHTERSFIQAIEDVLGPGSGQSLATALETRYRLVVEQAADWPDPRKQLALFQLDAFLVGWMAHRRYSEQQD